MTSTRVATSGTVAVRPAGTPPDFPVSAVPDRGVSSPTMATKPPKRKVKGGRVTPKGGGSTSRPAPSSRYTPPIPQSQKVSPTWVPVLMFALLAVGFLIIFLNYIDVLPGGTSNTYLLIGLGAILGGIVTATQYH